MVQVFLYLLYYLTQIMETKIVKDDKPSWCLSVAETLKGYS
jgi:hypothetical protein